jgi:hypothetical protein
MRKLVTAALAASALAGAAFATTGTASARPYWGPGYYHRYWYGPHPYWYGPRPFYGPYWGPGYYGWRHHYWRRW